MVYSYIASHSRGVCCSLCIIWSSAIWFLIQTSILKHTGYSILIFSALPALLVLLTSFQCSLSLFAVGFSDKETARNSHGNFISRYSNGCLSGIPSEGSSYPAFCSTVLSLAVTILIWLLKENGIPDCSIKRSYFHLFSAFYSLFLITYLSEKKTEENIKIQLVSYSTENDPTAEHLLLDMWPVISADSTLRKMMDVDVFEKDDFDNILEYLHEEYFNGYWGNFNLSIVLCQKNDSLSVGVQNRIYEDCYSFFERKI